MEQRIVLRGGDRKLEHLADEERHYRAASAALRLEMGDIGNGHVVGKFECFIPVRVPVENTGTEAQGPEPVAVFVDACHPGEKLLPLIE